MNAQPDDLDATIAVASRRYELLMLVRNRRKRLAALVDYFNSERDRQTAAVLEAERQLEAFDREAERAPA